MKIVLFVLAGFFFLAPVLFWLYLGELACGYNLSSKPCPLPDFIDSEFAMIAALPWLIGLLALVGALRR